MNSCNPNNTLFLVSESVGNLNEKSSVTINGYEVGKVERVNLEKDGRIVVEINVTKDFKIPSDSKFINSNNDLFGNSGIKIKVGQEKNYLKNGDTLRMERKSSENIENGIFKLIDNLTGKNKNDSILIELRRLNENLERFQPGTEK